MYVINKNESLRLYKAFASQQCKIFKIYVWSSFGYLPGNSLLPVVLLRSAALPDILYLFVFVLYSPKFLSIDYTE